MPPTLDLELIKTFLAVLDAKGFKSAADRLNKTPAAISLQIKRLEDIVGKRVLERSNQGISLTSAGEVLKDKGQQLMSLNYELLGDLRENELSGHLSFGAPSDYTPTLLKKLLPIFQSEFPSITPTIFLEPSRSLRPRVNAGTLDVAIVAREPDEDKGSALWAEEVAWYGASQSTDGAHRVGTLAANCVLRDRALEDLSTVPNSHKHVLEAATVAALRDAVEAGFCQALLPASVADGLRRSPLTKSNPPFDLTFDLIAGPRFDKDEAERIARKFRRVLGF